MGSSGVGRGRGWLNLTKENRNRPGHPLSPQDTINNEHQWSKPGILTTPPVQQYVNLISLISQISVNDDGILLNQKLKAIIEVWERDCSSSNEVVESFQYLYNKCLEEENLVLKVVIMISSYTFMTTPISGEYLRPLFIRQMQNTYDNGKQLQSGNPTKFRNAVKMLGEYFNRAKLINGQPINVLVSPLLCYFEMLLDSVQPADLELFASQLYLTGSAIKNSFQQQLNDVMNKVRKVLITNGELTKTCRLYLLLAIEIADNRYSLIPADVHSFYQEQLGEQVMAQFQGVLGALSIQTQQSNKTLDGYQSSVNVLQVSPPEPSSPINDQIQNQQQNQELQPNQQQQSQSHQESHSQSHTQSHSQSQQSSQKQNQQHLVQQQQNSLSSNSHQNKSAQNYSSSNNFNSNEINSYVNWDENKDKPNNNRTEKTGRPILGSGARLKNKDKDGGGNWKGLSKDGCGGEWRGLNKDGGGGEWRGLNKDGDGGVWRGNGGDKSGSFWREKKPSTKNYRKGWEHDDRFSTDYN